MPDNAYRTSKIQFISNTPKIYVAGHRGMVGSAIVRQLPQSGVIAAYKVASSCPFTL